MDLAFDDSWDNDTVVTRGLPTILEEEPAIAERPATIDDERPTAPSLEAAAAEEMAERGPRQSSYVGAIPLEHDDVRARRHQELVGAWSALAEKAAISSWDGSIKAAAETLAERVAEIGEACAFLARVKEHAKESSLADVLADDTALAAYLAGVYLWLGEVVLALDALAEELADMTPKWSALRARLEETQWILELADRERVKVEEHDLAWLPGHVERDVAQLFEAVGAVRAGLEQKFG